MSSNPPGISLLAANTEAASPFTVPAIIGSEIQLAAPQTATIGGVDYTFSSWSDGGGREHPILVSALQTAYTASYTAADGGGGGGGSGDGGGGTGGGDGGGGTSEPPQTVLGKHPPKITRATTAKFSFRPAGATFACKLDGKPKAACGATKTYKKLKPGRHTLKVWASAKGKTDPTPAKFSWKILPPKR